MKDRLRQMINSPIYSLLVLVLFCTSNNILAGNKEVALTKDCVTTRIRLSDRNFAKPFRVSADLKGCSISGKVISQKRDDGTLELKKVFVNDSLKTSCLLIERYSPNKEGIHCEIEIHGNDIPWTTEINTNIYYCPEKSSRFWTAWADPRKNDRNITESSIKNGTVPFGDNWSDPLSPQIFFDDTLYYGAPFFRYNRPLKGFIPFQRNLFCIPLITILDEKRDAGMSVVLNPEDDILDLTLQVKADGSITFSRLFNRISKKNVLHFSFDLIPHEADWRGGLRWMSCHYPQYFNPANPKADEIAGTAAYSDRDVDLDVAKMKKMAFSVNWRASYDFPYMGMFIPPLDTLTIWNRFGGGTISVSGLEQYSRKMREMGFHVLSYFNVTEFGAKMKYPLTANKIPNDSLVWRDPNAYFFYKLKDALLAVPDRIVSSDSRNIKGAWVSWKGAIATDPGEPVYREFLLDQANKHIRYIPASDGICIDRLDWLRMYNERRDDGISWFIDRPSRSLITSWKGLMKDLGPIMHQNNKVIFVNNHIKRIDLLREVDGSLDEFTYGGSPLNLTAFLCINKPALGWTNDATPIKTEDVDHFFQKYLYMGVYPMAPYPGNDHSILPDEWVDKQYLDYGPLLMAMRGKKWVLESHCVEVAENSAKANLFKVHDGYVIPVVLGDKTNHVTVNIRNISGLDDMVCHAMYPGRESTVRLTSKFKSGTLQIQVPLIRGCAMIRIGKPKTSE